MIKPIYRYTQSSSSSDDDDDNNDDNNNYDNDKESICLKNKNITIVAANDEDNNNDDDYDTIHINRTSTSTSSALSTSSLGETTLLKSPQHTYKDYDYNNLSISYMINDIKINALPNSQIKLHFSLMNEFGEKTYRIVDGDIFFNVYIEVKKRQENISKLLIGLVFFDNTPEYIENMYTAMGYTSKPIPVWRLQLNRNKLNYIQEFCLSTHRKMFLNTELNNALPLVQKSLGIYIEIPNYATSETMGSMSSQQNFRYRQRYNQIPYRQIWRPTKIQTSAMTYACRKLSIDIEVLTPSYWTLFPEAQEKGCEIIIIACTYQLNDNAYETDILYTDKLQRTVTIDYTTTDDDGNTRTEQQPIRRFKCFDDEEKMLIHFIGMINAQTIDLITGWNVRNFDLKYIYDRCIAFYPHLLVKFQTWSLDGRDITFKSVLCKGQNITLVDCFGIIILDMYDYNKTNVKAKSYKLKDIAKIYLPDDKQKLTMDYKNISRFYVEGSDKEFSHLLAYCSIDAEIVLDLMTIQKVWNNTICMADICHVPLNYVINHGVMLRNMCMIAEFINTNTNYLIPYKHEHPFVQYEGGFVHNPIVGFHTNPIFVLDFNSLYPTTMLAFNICTTTIVHMDEIDMDCNKRLTTTSTSDDDNGYHKNGIFQPQELTDLVFHANLNSPTTTTTTTVVSATPYMTNVGFVETSQRRGVMPQILDNLLKTRKRIQNELKSTTCIQKRKQLDAQQLTYKLCANAIYGLLGCSFSSLYHPEVAASVTGFGRFLSYIKRKRITEYMTADNINGRIIYGDTDSVMVEVLNRSIAETRTIAIDYAERVTRDIGIVPIRTEYEKIFCPFLIHKKKHYIGVIYTNNCEKYDKIEYKGNEMVRSDNCSLTTIVMKNIVDILFFWKQTPDEKLTRIDEWLTEFLVDWVQLYKHYQNGDPIDSINRDLLHRITNMATYSKKLSKIVYKNKLPHVAVYERLKNTKQYKVGDRIDYCIAYTEFTDKIRPTKNTDMAYDIDEVLDSNNNLYLVVHYYMDSCLRKPLARLYASLDPQYTERLNTLITRLFPPITNLQEGRTTSQSGSRKRTKKTDVITKKIKKS